MPIVEPPVHQQSVAVIETRAEQNGFPEIGHHRKMRVEPFYP